MVCARETKVQVFVSGTELARDMSRVIRGARSTKTTTFPSTVRKVLDGAFSDTSVKSVILNEGLEVLGECGARNCRGVFSWTRLRLVALPSTLRMIGNRAFYDCKRLRRATFCEDSRLQKIGELCFCWSGLEEFTAPSLLREMGWGAFEACGSLKWVTLNEGLDALGDHQDGKNRRETFWSSKRKERRLQSMLKGIDRHAFKWCNSLQAISVK